MYELVGYSVHIHSNQLGHSYRTYVSFNMVILVGIFGLVWLLGVSGYNSYIEHSYRSGYGIIDEIDEKLGVWL